MKMADSTMTLTVEPRTEKAEAALTHIADIIERIGDSDLFYVQMNGVEFLGSYENYVKVMGAVPVQAMKGKR